MSDMVTVTAAGTANVKLKNLDVGIRQGLTKAGVFFINRVKRTFQLFAPRGHASGRLIRSLAVSPVKLVNGVYHCRAGPTVDYGWWVHQGRRPGKMPPIDKIYEWVKEKGLVSQFTGKLTMNKKTGKVSKSRRKKVDIERDRRTLAFLIARKIGKVGIKPFPFLTATYKPIKAELEKIIISSVIKSLKS